MRVKKGEFELMSSDLSTFSPLGIIALKSCKELGEKVDAHIRALRKDPDNTSYMIPIQDIRFSNGEGKVKIMDSVRGKDIYILCDISNYSCTYNMYGFENHMGPDEHFRDIKRVISAIGGKASRVTVIMPLLYSSRQHKRKGRESLDCAMALQELEHLGISTLLTFDAHDPTIQNAIPLVSFENVYPTYTILKYFLNDHKGIKVDKDNFIVMSPDTGAMDRAIYFANILGLDVGMFYKRRDFSTVINGKNPIIEHEYIGRDVEGKNILIIDDMIASGESVFDIADELKKRKAKEINIATTFAFFTEGIEKFNKYFEEGKIKSVYSTNLTYLPEKVKNAPWFREVDMSKFVGKLISTLNYNHSISPLLDARARIQQLLNKKK